MRAAACLLFLVTVPAWAVSVGETYPQVISEKGNTRSSIVAGSMRMLNYPGLMIKLKDGVVVSITATEYKAPAAVPPAPTPPPSATPTPVPPTQTPASQVQALADQVNAAVREILAIVNAPVSHIPRQAGMRIQYFGKMWFQAGANRPDFKNPDIAKTQELPYAKFGYVSSDLNPNEAFVGSDLEFNPMTKFFYVDRTLPKKRLTAEQMGELDRLYRIIGECEPKLISLGYKGQMP